MIIGLDLDNTSQKYTAGVRTFFATQLGYSETQAAEYFPDPKDYGFQEWDKHLPMPFLDYHVECVALGLYRTFETYPDASEYLWRLSNAGEHIRVITSRFVKEGQHAQVVADTAYSLDKTDIPYRDISFTSVKTDVYADLYIEDAPHNITALESIGRKVLIFDHEYNRHLPGDRVDNWADAYKYIVDFSTALVTP